MGIHTIELSLSKWEERDKGRDPARERALLSQAWSLVSVIPALTVLGGRIPSSRQAWVMQQDTVSKMDIQKPCQLGSGEEISDEYDSENEDAIKKQQGVVTDNGGVSMMSIGLKELKRRLTSRSPPANPAPGFKSAVLDIASCPFPQTPKSKAHH